MITFKEVCQKKWVYSNTFFHKEQEDIISLANIHSALLHLKSMMNNASLVMRKPKRHRHCPLLGAHRQPAPRSPSGPSPMVTTPPWLVATCTPGASGAPGTSSTRRIFQEWETIPSFCSKPFTLGIVSTQRGAGNWIPRNEREEDGEWRRRWLGWPGWAAGKLPMALHSAVRLIAILV